MQRLQADLERMQRELAGATGLLTSARSDTAAELARGTALEQAVKERDEHIVGLQQGIANRDARIDELEAQLREALDEHEALRKARRREADAAYLSGIAAEVFNRSPHRQEVANLTARMGEPTVRIAAEGITLPRPVRVIFGWPQGWRSYRVHVRPRGPAVRRRARRRRAQRQARAAARAAAGQRAARRRPPGGRRRHVLTAAASARSLRLRRRQRVAMGRASTRPATNPPMCAKYAMPNDSSGATSAADPDSTCSAEVREQQDEGGDLDDVQEERHERDARQHAGARVEHEVSAEDAR